MDCIRKNRVKILALILCLGGSLLPSEFHGQSSDSTRPSSRYYYWLINEDTGQVLAVQPDGGRRLRLERRRIEERQYWQFRRTPDGVLRLRNELRRDLSLDVINDDADENVHMAPAGDFSGQDWHPRRARDGTYVLTNSFTGPDKVLTQRPDGAEPYLTSAPQGHSHHWRLRRAVSVDLPTYFGFRSMLRYGRVALRERPLLVTMVTDPNLDGAHKSTCGDYVADLFGSHVQWSVNDRFEAYSGGRFRWSVADCRAVDLPPHPGGTPWRSPERAARVVRKLIADRFDFRRYDANGDGRVTTDELTILAILNQIGSGAGGSTRTPKEPHKGLWECLQYDSPVEICLKQGVTAVYIAPADKMETLRRTVAHELVHTLGGNDLYFPGDFSSSQHAASYRLTLMSYGEHLDPWHRIALGWVKPRVRSLRRSGVAILPLAHRGGDERPIALYDRRRGFSEYFLLEYRSTSRDFDANADGAGLIVWHVRQKENHTPDYQPESDCKPGVENPPAWCASATCRPGDRASCAAAYGCQPTDHRDVGYWCRPITSPATLSSAGKLGVNEVWPVGTESSALRWKDGTPVGVTLSVRRVDDDGLIVRWEPMN